MGTPIISTSKTLLKSLRSLWNSESTNILQQMRLWKIISALISMEMIYEATDVHISQSAFVVTVTHSFKCWGSLCVAQGVGHSHRKRSVPSTTVSTFKQFYLSGGDRHRDQDHSVVWWGHSRRLNSKLRGEYGTVVYIPPEVDSGTSEAGGYEVFLSLEIWIWRQGAGGWLVARTWGWAGHDRSSRQVFFWGVVKKGHSSVGTTMKPQLSAQGFHCMRNSELWRNVKTE